MWSFVAQISFARSITFGLGAFLVCALGPAAEAGEIRVFSGGAPQAALRAMTPELENISGHRVQFTFALVTAIQQKLVAGEAADLVMLPIPLMAAIEKSMPLRTEGRGTLARVGISVIVPDGSPQPNIGSTDAVLKLLLTARKIAVPEPSTPGGAHMARIIEGFGLRELLKEKVIVRAAINGGAELVATGEADAGFYLLSEAQTIRGVTIVGLLPPILQNYVVYGSAVPVSNDRPEAALAYVNFISHPERAERWRAAGFELVPPGR